MNALSGKIAAAAFALATVGTSVAVSPAPVAQVPPEVAAMLKEHRGKWRTEGQWISHGKAQPAKASWECKAAVDGIGNVCTWNHEWADRAPDSALEIMGYDPDQKALSITRVTDRGFIHTATPIIVRGNTMTRRWESNEDGKISVGVNEIVVKAPGDWVQHMTIEVDGKRITEMNVTHHRVK